MEASFFTQQAENPQKICTFAITIMNKMDTTTATIPDLNAQLFLQLSNIADNESYLQKTLDFIIGLAKSENRTNARGRAYTELLERLSDFQEYEAGWDGDNALPLNHLAVKNFKSLLQESDDSDLIGWTLFPAANGTLLFQNKKRKSGINIGAEGFSYYTIENGEARGENNLAFSPQAVLNIMKQI